MNKTIAKLNKGEKILHELAYAASQLAQRWLRWRKIGYRICRPRHYSKLYIVGATPTKLYTFDIIYKATKNKMEVNKMLKLENLKKYNIETQSSNKQKLIKDLVLTATFYFIKYKLTSKVFSNKEDLVNELKEIVEVINIQFDNDINKIISEITYNYKKDNGKFDGRIKLSENDKMYIAHEGFRIAANTAYKIESEAR